MIDLYVLFLSLKVLKHEKMKLCKIEFEYFHNLLYIVKLGRNRFVFNIKIPLVINCNFSFTRNFNIFIVKVIFLTQLLF